MISGDSLLVSVVDAILTSKVPRQALNQTFVHGQTCSFNTMFQVCNRLLLGVQKSVYTHSVPVVAAEAVPALTKTTESVPVSTASPPDAEGKEQSQTKQAKQEMRSFPTDLDKVDCAKDGNCVLHAFSKALKHFKDEDRHPRVLRAELVTHMLKHERYSRAWDKFDPSGNRLESFEEYCEIIERDGVRLGELEISALAHVTHFRLSWSHKVWTFAWNAKEKKLIVLWYSASHIDLALPRGADAKKYPDDCRKIVSGPVCGFRSGGRPTSTASVSSCATVPKDRAPSCLSGDSAVSVKGLARARASKKGSGGMPSDESVSSCATALRARVASAASGSSAPAIAVGSPRVKNSMTQCNSHSLSSNLRTGEEQDLTLNARLCSVSFAHSRVLLAHM